LLPSISGALDKFAPLEDLGNDELDDLFCDENCGTNLMAAGRKLSGEEETSDVATIVFGSADLAI